MQQTIGVITKFTLISNTIQCHLDMNTDVIQKYQLCNMPTYGLPIYRTWASVIISRIL